MWWVNIMWCRMLIACLHLYCKKSIPAMMKPKTCGSSIKFILSGEPHSSGDAPGGPHQRSAVPSFLKSRQDFACSEAAGISTSVRHGMVRHVSNRHSCRWKMAHILALLYDYYSSIAYRSVHSPRVAVLFLKHLLQVLQVCISCPDV